MTVTTASVAPAGICWDCGGPCLTYRGSERTPATVLNRSGMHDPYSLGSRAVVRLAYVVGVAARAVLVTPLSGPLARFGKAGASALALWADRSGVSLEVIDAYPSAASAIRAAES